MSQKHPRCALTAALIAAIDAVEWRGVRGSPIASLVSLGWQMPMLDIAPGSVSRADGLSRGSIHEWFTNDPAWGWVLCCCTLPAVPRPTVSRGDSSCKPVIWIGRRCCPCTLEGGKDAPALRLGMRLVDGLAQPAADAVANATHSCGPFHTVESLWRSANIGVAALRKLAAADAFGSMGLDRPQALWQIRRLRDEHLPLFD